MMCPTRPAKVPHWDVSIGGDDGTFGLPPCQMVCKHGREGIRYHQSPAQIDDFYLVDVDGPAVVFDLVSGPDIAAPDRLISSRCSDPC
jgi:hypothetical protein